MSREQRTEATRAQLLGAARALFSERGYSAVGTEEIVARAGVTRGALYHHFADKKDLFRAVHEQIEQELVASIGAKMGAVDDPWELMLTGTRAFLDACLDPAIIRISLLDAPVVLGWQEWSPLGSRTRWTGACCAARRYARWPTCSWARSPRARF
jgi:AcrR family transcriptional regulator